MNAAVRATSILCWPLIGTTALKARGYAGFFLANGTKSGHPCAVKIVENIRQCTAEQLLGGNQALRFLRRQSLS